MTQEKSTYAVGKRKTSIAKVFLKSGTGKILINEKDLSVYFESLGSEKELVKKPLLLVNGQNLYDLRIFVKGGGTDSQLDATMLAISKALISLNSSFRKILKQESLLRSDSRIKERRKYGLKKARKAGQYSKR